MELNLSPAFIESFVTACDAAGLDKEATTQLLLREVDLTRASDSPAFASTYQLPARVVAAPVIKNASGRAGLQLLRTGAGQVARAVRGRAAGASRTGTGQTADWIRTNPLKAVGAGSAAAAGLTGAGLAIARGPNDGRDIGGGYQHFDAEAAARARHRDLAGRSEDLADINERIQGDPSRNAELRSGLNTPMAGAANRELQQREQQRQGALGERDRMHERLDKERAARQKQLDRLMKRQDSLRSRSETPTWRSPRRWFDNITGRSDYGSRLDDIAGAAGQARHELDMTQQLQRRLRSGFTGSTPVSEHRRPDLQQRFFRDI